MAETKDNLQKQLTEEAQAAWDALRPLRDTWDDKERALLAQVNDSFSGNITRARVTDASLSTLAYERQARVAAQLPSGKVNPASKKEEGKAKLANIVLQRYIIPNCGRDFDMLILQRMWGVYASVYGSMPMFYDYCVEDDYIGPYAQLIDPRSFLPQPGFNSTKVADWAMVSTIVSIENDLKPILKKKNTTWDKAAIRKLLQQAKDAKPARDDDANKDSVVNLTRYDKTQAKGRVELITKYERGEKGRWITFAPDYDGLILRDIPNPHKSGKIPIVMRHCFPLMNSIYGLGDFERGMKIQKSKDSLLGLRLEYVKNRVFPPLMINTAQATASTIKNGANQRWLVTDMNNSVKPVNYGSESMNEFQSTYSLLEGIQQNQFGSTTTQLSADEAGNPSFGRTPAAIQKQESRENARDTWDRFMHEKAVEELYEGMLNLLTVKMEKPISMTVFEEEIKQIGKDSPEVLELFDDNGKTGRLTLAKKDLKSDNGYCYVIDANSSMKQDDEAQLAALLQTYQMLVKDPNLAARLQMRGFEWDDAEHLKKIFLVSGIQDPEQILKEGQAQNTNSDTTLTETGMALPQDMPMDMPMQQPLTDHPAMHEDDPNIAAFAQQIIGQQQVLPQGGVNGY